MSESENASMDSVWNFVASNPRILGLPLTESKGLDLLSAMRDVYVEIDEDPEKAKVLLTLLATVLVAAAKGEGDEVVEEVIVSEAMVGIDKEIRKVLNEGQ